MSEPKTERQYLARIEQLEGERALICRKLALKPDALIEEIQARIARLAGEGSRTVFTKYVYGGRGEPRKSD